MTHLVEQLRGEAETSIAAMREAALRARDTLENAFAKSGMPLADQMAWRSMCAHGWWAQVRPAPLGRGRPDRDWPGQPFWDHGCPPECL